jgi:hypothetical protein
MMMVRRVNRRRRMDRRKGRGVRTRSKKERGKKVKGRVNAMTARRTMKNEISCSATCAHVTAVLETLGMRMWSLLVLQRKCNKRSVHVPAKPHVTVMTSANNAVTVLIANPVLGL